MQETKGTRQPYDQGSRNQWRVENHKNKVYIGANAQQNVLASGSPRSIML